MTVSSFVWRRISRFPLLLLIAALVIAVPMAAEAKRIAFVVGINDYANLDPGAQLKTALNDARGITETLRKLRFAVTSVENATRRDFNDAWQGFLGEIVPEDEVVFYFAGHGVEIEGQNFLIPGDIPKISFGRQEQIKRESLSLSELLLDLGNRRPRVSLVILDACRDHPLAPREWRAGKKPGGLANIDPPQGTFIMYSAGSGERALDQLPSDDPDLTPSVYTRKLRPLMTVPGVSLTELAKRIRQEVYDLAATVLHRQTPAYYDGVLGDYCLAGCEAPGPEGSAVKPSQLRPPTVDGSAPRRMVRTYNGHKSGVTSVAFSADGDFALSGSEDSTLKLWDLAAIQEVRTFVGHSKTVNAVGFLPDGRSALSASDDGTLKLWDVSTGQEMRSFAHSYPVSTFALSRDGRFALSGGCTHLGVSPNGFGLGCPSELKLWDLTSGQEQHLNFGRHEGPINSLAFLPDGRRALASCRGNQSFELWDLGADRELRSFTVSTGWFGPKLRFVAFSQDARFALSTPFGQSEVTLKLWEVATGKEVRAFTSAESVRAIALSPDGHLALSGGEEMLRLWDIAAGKEVHNFTGHLNSVLSVAFSPDGRFALSGSDDKTLKLWDLSEWTKPRQGVSVVHKSVH